MLVKTTLAQQMRVTAQMVLTSHLLRMTGAEVEGAIARELADNPALESTGFHLTPNVTPEPYQSTSQSYRMSSNIGRLGSDTVSDSDDSDSSECIASRESLMEQLVSQARLMVPSDELEIVTYLIYSLDKHGFLRVPENELAHDLGVSLERVKQNIAWLHQLEPPGIGARNVRECLLLQCTDLEAEGVDCKVVRCILGQAWDDLLHQRWKRVVRLTGLSQQDLHDALQFIRRDLYPYPLLLVPNMPEDESLFVCPDLIVHLNTEDSHSRFSIEIPAADAYELRINPTFQRTARTSANRESELEPAEREWIQQAIERARTFLSALAQRWATLRRIGEFLVEYQSGFFEHGPQYLKPLTRALVAQRLGLHESTISRAVSDKILQLPDHQLIELSDLFDGSLAAKEAIRQIIAESSEPLSDREIAARLQQKSFNLSRRTVTKYREQLGIPTMSRRTRAQAPYHCTTLSPDDERISER